MSLSLFGIQKSRGIRDYKLRFIHIMKRTISISLLTMLSSLWLMGILCGCADDLQPITPTYPTLKYAPMHLNDEWRYYSVRDKDTLFMFIDNAEKHQGKVYFTLRMGWAFKNTPLQTRYLRSDGEKKLFEWFAADSSENVVLDFGATSPDSVKMGVEYKSGTADALTVPAGNFTSLLVTNAIKGKEGESMQTHYAENVGAVRVLYSGGIIPNDDTLLLTFARIESKLYGKP